MKQTWPSEEDKLFVPGVVKPGEILFVFASKSSSTVREMQFYAISEEAAKLAAHEYCKLARRHFVSLRPAVVDIHSTIANYRRRNAGATEDDTKLSLPELVDATAQPATAKA